MAISDTAHSFDDSAGYERFIGSWGRAAGAIFLDWLAPSTGAHWLDIGCGEGYYTAQIAQALPHAQGYALDISREAVKRACRRAPQVTWMVASMARVPLLDASCQFIASVFSPLDWQEAKRLLSPGGGLMRGQFLRSTIVTGDATTTD